MHRDVKPANILVRHDGHPFLIDFGLARKLSAASSLTSTGVVMGTPWYMAPEVLAGDTAKVGRRFRCLCAGARLFEIATCSPPFRARTYEELRKKVLEEEPPHLRGLDATYAKLVEPIALRALEKQPQHRHRNAGEFADDLDRAVTGLQPASRWPPLLLRRAMRRFDRQRLRIAGLALVVLGGVAAASWIIASEARAGRRETQFRWYLDNGQMALDRAELGSAREMFAQAQRLEPTNPEVDLHFAVACWLFDLHAEARGCLEQAHRRDSSSARKRNAIPCDCWAPVSTSSARAILPAPSVASRRGRRGFRVVRGTSRALRGRSQAEPTRRGGEAVEGVSERPETAQSQYLIREAQIQELQGDFAGALETLRSGEMMSIDDPFVVHQRHRHLGRALCRVGEYDESEKELMTALASDSADAASWGNLAIVHYRTHRPELATTSARRALELDPHNVPSHAVLANIAADEGRVDEASAHLDSALQLDPALERGDDFRIRLMFDRGEILWKLGRYEEADARFSECLRLDPEHLGAWCFRAQHFWLERQDYAGALAAFLQAERLWRKFDSNARSGEVTAYGSFLKRHTLREILIGKFATACQLGSDEHLAATAQELRSGLMEPGPDEDGVAAFQVINLAEALAECGSEKFRDCSWARSLLDSESIQHPVLELPEVREIVGKVNRLCPKDK